MGQARSRIPQSGGREGGWGRRLRGWARICALALLGVGTGLPSAAARELTQDELSALAERHTYGMNPPTAAALATARQIGKERNLDGLRSLIEMGHVGLLREAVKSYDLAPARLLPPVYEGLILEHYDRPVGPVLRGLFGRQLSQGLRIPQFQTQALFDRLYADLAARPNQSGLAYKLVATSLVGIEPRLVALLPRLSLAGANELVNLLGLRRDPGAVSALREIQQRVALGKDVNGLLLNVDRALLRIATPEAINALLQRLEWLGAQTDNSRAMSEIGGILAAVAEQDPAAPPSYEALRARLPAELRSSARSRHVDLIRAHQRRDGVPALIRYLLAGEHSALELLLELGTPDDWRSARRGLDTPPASSALNEGQRRELALRLDAALADPATSRARSEQARRERAWRDELVALNRRGHDIAKLRENNPQLYLSRQQAWLDDKAALIARYTDLPAARRAQASLRHAYRDLANELRFRLGQTEAALALYRQATEPVSSAGLAPLDLVRADIARFEQGRPAQALAVYRQMSAQLADTAAAGAGGDAAMIQALGRWLKHEIAFLGNGRRFGGPLHSADMGAAYVWTLVVSGFAPSAPPELEALMRRAMDGEAGAGSALQGTLDGLPASQFQLLASFPAALALPDPAMRAHFARIDPAGYLTAALAGLYREQARDAGQGADPADPLAVMSARHRAWQARRLQILLDAVGIAPAPAADPGLATPEATWRRFVTALDRGDTAAVLACLTPRLARHMEPLFAHISAQARQQMAQSFRHHVVEPGAGPYQEIVVVRGAGEEARAAIVTLIRVGQEWKIDSL